MAAHRYWRVRSSDTAIGGEYLAFAEVEMKSAFAGADLTAGKTVSASATAGGAYVPGSAIDNNASTFWTTGATAPPVGGHWYAVDFGAGGDVDIVEITLQVRPDGYREDPLNLFVEYSDDGSTWTLQYSLSGLPTWGAGEKRTFRFDGTNGALVNPSLRVNQAYAYLVANGKRGLTINQAYAYVVTNGKRALTVNQQYAYAVINTPSTPDPGVNQSRRYWRLLITKDQRITGGGNYYCNVAELDLLGGYGVENSYTGAAFSSTGNFSGATYDAAKAFDNNSGTPWSGDMNTDPAVNPRWLQCDFGTAKQVYTVSITAYDASAPRDFKIQYSDDGVVWTTFIEVTGQTGWTGGQTRTFDPVNYPPLAVASGRLRAAQIIG